ncbi:hypothetical protein F5Y06DRAFT_302761 [Hypoxylon sp. FL0890]|nr:hypothetical protein F5Y06DRAFT_302761 [Hypoxylon sp. FL0890]
MRVLTILASVAALAAGAFAAPAPSALPSPAGNSVDGPYSINSSDPNLAGNVTTLSHYHCKFNFFPANNLTDGEALDMEWCYASFNRTIWHVKPVPCPGTNKIWQIWGHHWQTPEHCFAACDECMYQAIGNRSANVYCDKRHGHWSICRVMYDTYAPLGSSIS